MTDGVQETVRNLRVFGDEVKAAMERGVFKAAVFLKDESQKIVPVDTGALKESWFIVRSADKQSATVGYDTPYSIYVHEDLTKYHAPPTSAKFLEHPARVHADTMQNIISEEVKDSQRTWAGRLLRKFFR